MLLAIAALHQVVGLAIGLGLDPNVRFEGTPPLRGMWADGVFASVGMNFARVGIAWFLLFGCALALVGLLAHQVERQGFGLPIAFLLGLGGLCAVGVFLMPASGFWLALLPLAVGLKRALADRRPAQQPTEQSR
jgi:Family of unknown function (DUF6463)